MGHKGSGVRLPTVTGGRCYLVISALSEKSAATTRAPTSQTATRTSAWSSGRALAPPANIPGVFDVPQCQGLHVKPARIEIQKRRRAARSRSRAHGVSTSAPRSPRGETVQLILLTGLANAAKAGPVSTAEGRAGQFWCWIRTGTSFDELRVRPNGRMCSPGEQWPFRGKQRQLGDYLAAAVSQAFQVTSAAPAVNALPKRTRGSFNSPLLARSRSTISSSPRRM